MRISIFTSRFLLLILFATSGFCATAQQGPQVLSDTILHYDSLFWKAYNTCDTAAIYQFITPDIEFYHDKGGITAGSAALVASIKNNLCGGNGYRLRREAIAGTVHVFPLQKGDAVYGAILSGEHQFYLSQNGGSPQLDGQARFTHLWLLQNGTWRMARILSFDHHAAHQPVPARTAIKQSDSQLNKFVGNYKGTKQNMALSVVKKEGELVLDAGGKLFTLLPETANRFFVADRDLTFEFVQNSKHEVLKMLIRENGAVVEEATATGKK